MPLLVGHLGERHVVTGPDARVADEEIESPELLDRSLDERGRAILRRDVRRMRERRHTVVLSQLDHECVGVRRATTVTNDDVDAVFREQARRRSADAPRATCDERAFPLQAVHRTRSTISQMRCSMHMWSSCALSVRSVGTMTE